MSALVLPTSKKRTTGFLVESCDECCGCAVLAVACFWPSTHCTPVPKFMSVPEELNHNRSLCVLGFTSVCAFTTPVHSLYELDRPGVPTNLSEGYIRCYTIVGGLASYVMWLFRYMLHYAKSTNIS